jgi:hypothetical protein
MEGFKALALIVGAARGLAIDGNEIVAIGPGLLDPGFETASEQDQANSIDQCLKPTHAGDAEMKLREPTQKIETMFAPCNDVFELVARGDGGRLEAGGPRLGDTPRAGAPDHRRSARHA